MSFYSIETTYAKISPPDPMQNFEIDTLYERLLNGNCVLVLGPELFRFDGKPLSRALYDHLKANGADKYILFYDFKDELFYFKGNRPEQSRNAIYLGTRRYLAGLNHGELHEKIARLPFPLIINLSPDLLLVNAFEKLQMAHEFRFYHKKNNRDPNNVQFRGDEDAELSASPENPLIYNLLGHIGYEESLVLTYDDLFDFLFNVFGRNNLPIALRRILEIQDSGQQKDYIFLGFRFNKWYLQMLLRLLNAQAGMHQFVLGEDMEALRHAMENDAAEDKGFFYLGNYFALEPIACNPADVLLHLYARAEQAGKLRPTGTLQVRPHIQPVSEKPLHMQLDEKLAKNKIREVVQVLLDYFEKENLPDARSQVTIASANYEALLQNQEKGLLFSNELWVSNNRVLEMLNTAIEAVHKRELQTVSTP